MWYCRKLVEVHYGSLYPKPHDICILMIRFCHYAVFNNHLSKRTSKHGSVLTLMVAVLFKDTLELPNVKKEINLARNATYTTNNPPKYKNMKQTLM